MELNKFSAPLSAILTELFEDGASENLNMDTDAARLEMLKKKMPEFKALAERMKPDLPFYRQVRKSLPEFLNTKILIHADKEMRLITMFKHLLIKWCFAHSESRRNVIAIYCVPTLVEIWNQKD